MRVAGFAFAAMLAGCGAKETRPPRQLFDAGVAAWAGGRTSEAEDLLKRSVERAAKSGMDVHSQRLYHAGLFEYYAAQNLLGNAERAYVGVETTTDFMINPVAGHNLGVLRMRAGKYPEAAEILRATRASLDTTTGCCDERPLTLMVLMHLDLAESASGKPDASLPADILEVFDDLTSFQQGDYPRLHPALLHEIQEYSSQLGAAGRSADARAIHDRLTTQLARGAAPGSAGRCLTLDWDPPFGCVLALSQ